MPDDPLEASASLRADAALKADLEHWADLERGHSGDTLPTPEELVAFHDGRLDDTSRRTLRRQLALQPRAASEYVDLVHFDELEPPTESHRLTDQDVAAAFAAIRGKIAPSSPSDSVLPDSVPSDSVLPDSVPSDQVPLVQAPLDISRAERLPRIAPPGAYNEASRRYQQLAVAAGILVALSAVWIGVLYQKLGQAQDLVSAPRYSQVFDISVTRGAGPTSVAKQEAPILLLIHDADLEEFTHGELEISNRQGDVLLKHSVSAPQDASLPLELSVERATFPDGAYRIALYGLDDQGRRVLKRDYRWQLASEPTD